MISSEIFFAIRQGGLHAGCRDPLSNCPKKALFMAHPGSVTESGLLAAAHRQGAGMVKQYLDHQRRHNWTTNPKTFPKNKKDQFLGVETRLREFQNVPVWKP